MAEDKKEETKSNTFFVTIKEDSELNVNGGYGSVSHSYGVTPIATYVDYDKLFSYLGKFRSLSPYQSSGNPFERSGGSDINNNFSLIGLETMERGAKYVRYFQPAAATLDTTSLVPVAGMNSSEWEQFKMWMRLDPVMYRLKTSIS